MKGTETPVIVLGDVNDGQHSNTVNILTEQPRYLVGDVQRRRRQRALHGADAAGATATAATSTTPTCTRTCGSRWTTSWSASSSTTTAGNRLWLFDGLVINNDHLNDENHKATGTGDHGVVKVRVPLAARQD